MKITIDIKYFLILTAVFILFTVIGTISHEYGHIAVAKWLGYETKLHYGSMSYYPEGYLNDPDFKAVNELTKDYANTEYDAVPLEIKEKADEYYEILRKRYSRKENNDSLLIRIGGPIQTILTGIIGLMILIIRRKSIRMNGLKLLDFLAVFLGLFWLREIFNLVTSIGGEILSPNGRWFGGDEYHISIRLNLWPGTIPIALGTLGLIISVYIICRIVPEKLRLTFILSGLIGGVSGFLLWMDLIGPIILP